MSHSSNPVFEYRKQIEFAETDMAGIVHFANFYRYMEVAEHAFYRSLGFSVHPGNAGIGWPRVQATCDFKRPLRFEDQVRVRVFIEEIRSKSVRYRFEFVPEGTDEIAAVGGMTVVSVQLGGEKMRAVAIPEDYRQRFEEAIAAAG
ncbi:MAG: thioesterase family protein [Verrucomicrobiota bacterium]